MNYSYDIQGWLSLDHIDGRTTQIPPPDHQLDAGFEWNFTGYKWKAMARHTEYTGTPYVTPAEVPVRHISVGAFFDRFGSQKWAILADTNPAVQALVKDCSVRKHIDLDRADLPMALGLLTSVGHTIDATEILTAPVQPGELP